MRKGLALAVLLPTTAWADTLKVGPGGFATLQAAVAAAQDGDVLQIAQGTYDGPLELDVDLELLAAGNVVVRAQGASVLDIHDATVKLVGLDLVADGGRAMAIRDATVQVLQGEFSGNSTSRQAFDGAAVAVSGSSDVTFTQVTFDDNEVTRAMLSGVQGVGGHLWVTGGTVRLVSCTLSGGRARRGGAIAATGGRVELTSTTLTDHAASDDGGAFWLDGQATVVLTDVTLRDAVASDEGGGFWARNGATISLTRTTTCDTSADDGGLAFLGSASLTATTSSLRQAKASATGGLAACGTGCTLALDFVDVVAASSGSAASLDAQNGQLTLSNTLILGAKGAPAVRAPGGSLAWVAWWDNATDTASGTARGSDAVTTDPLLPAWATSPGCDTVLRRLPTSPLVDAGDPAVTEADGTRADIGALGGAELAASLHADRDGDGSDARYDCDDGVPHIKPGVEERCDGEDDDCDGRIDQPPPPSATTWFRDADGDDRGRDDETLLACERPSGWSALGGDCDDTDDEIHPGATELCDGIDNDCMGGIDAGARDQLTWYRDLDEDGYGANGISQLGCSQPPGYLLRAGDCDDDDPEINPDGTEVCDGKDDDCDGRVDQPQPIGGKPYYPDLDGDGFGGGSPLIACSLPEGYGRDDVDCDDTDPDVYPVAPESCDGPFVDLNCDGLTGKTDNDGDGWLACQDCDDTDPATFPGAEETWYDGIIRNCDSLSDYDQDGDGFESDQYEGTDCDDTNPQIYPGGPETYDDDIDFNCDGDPGENFRSGGCTCDGGGGPGALLLLPLLIGLRRRRA
ncbi:MAG: putative metal-binding motif-containing protein [Alphaproteobacteria bacterium]|nr:putative metal-binding motif-containing protein [Alphaproteobacteria bacterium]